MVSEAFNRAQEYLQMHPPLPSSSNSSTDRRIRAYSSSRHGKRCASGRDATCRTCIARSQGSSGRFSTARSKAPSGGGGRIAIARFRVARARRAALECGVGAATLVPPVRFTLGVPIAPRFRREGVRGRNTCSSSGAPLLASSSESCSWVYSSPPSSSPSDWDSTRDGRAS